MSHNSEISHDDVMMSAQQRLSSIIDYAYRLFCQQVVGRIIQIENEASMQLHLSNILLQLGRLNVFFPDEFFNIELEKKIDLMRETGKSKNMKARVDIWIELKKADVVISAAAIELKFLKKSATAAVTDERHSVYKDLENLEEYAVTHPGLSLCEIVASTNSNFLENKGEKFSISNGTIIQSYEKEDSTYCKIKLTKQYEPIKWDRMGDYCFLKIVPKCSN